MRLRKIVVERVTVVKFRVDNRGSIRNMHTNLNLPYEQPKVKVIGWRWGAIVSKA